MSFRFRHAICNEVYKGWDFRTACQSIRKAGYTGIEIAPFTLAEDPCTLTPAQRRECTKVMAEEGLEFVGLHWLMVSPPGLHVTTPDHALRARGWRHIHDLIDLCADLGPNGKMIFGSPKQRTSTGGISATEATKHYVDGMSVAGLRAAERGVTLLIEALPPADTDVVTSLDEAAAWVNQIGNPFVRTMFDSHNAVQETEPHAVLVERHYPLIRHVHVNELDGKHPGKGNYDFKPVLSILAERNYQGWVSLEAFDFSFGAETIANESIRHMETQITALNL
ncbi:MAG: sugar phosphate isomerase/epimerase [Acidobacteria bacterium]|nr:sugar phosphate isomerase/epimerase [Acidobacteriota bacterium]